MKLRHLTGKTYLLETPAAALGVYRLDGGRCLLIDSGEDRDGSRVLETIAGQGWQIAALINTHAHSDHCGANQLIAAQTGCTIYASPREKIFLENPWLIAYTLFSAHPPRALANRFIVPPASPQAEVLPPGTHDIDGETFAVIDLSGHSPGQIGVMTPDGVLFAGDTLLAEGVYRVFPCLLMADVKQHEAALNRLRETSYNLLCIAHGGCITDSAPLIKQNSGWLAELLAEVPAALKGRRYSREELVGAIIQQRKLPVNTTQYYLAWASLSAVLSYHLDNRRIQVHYTEAGIRYST